MSRIVSPPPATLPLIALGALFVILWRGRWQNLGVLPVCAGLLLWATHERPALLISDDGGLVGRMASEGRALSKPKGAGFAATVWLENDGDVPDQAMAAQRSMPALDVGPVRVVQVTGRGWQEVAREACGIADLVILNKLWEEERPDDCLLIDLGFLRESGALALSEMDGEVRLRTAYAVSGVRYWNTPALRGERGVTARVARAERLPAAMGLWFGQTDAQATRFAFAKR
ncbi:hypothetical protein [Celeribacter sp. PS-C1]|uniref:hypothetical protein n=1 Tax=Celeribacter sp. PS-C1 TaxID=2820813 RepID=UPI00351CCDEC